MQFTNTGLILFTENYGACVAFYRDVLGLEPGFTDGDGVWAMTSFAFGGGYLVLETGGTAQPDGKSVAQSPVKLRFNVADVGVAAEELRTKGVDVTVIAHDWGTTAEFLDPDGNLCALRSEDGTHQGAKECTKS